MPDNLLSKNSESDLTEELSFPQEKKQKTLVYILILAISAILIVLYFGFWRSSPSVVSPDSQASPDSQSIEKTIKGIDFNSLFLKDPNFQALKIYGKWPLETETKGRANPFLPF